MGPLDAWLILYCDEFMHKDRRTEKIVPQPAPVRAVAPGEEFHEAVCVRAYTHTHHTHKPNLQTARQTRSRT